MFTGLIAALLATFAVLLPHPVRAQAVQPPPPAPVSESRRAPAPTPPKVGLPSAATGVQPQGSDDVATQLPAETDSRQIDCPDGVHVGVMVDGAVTGCS